MLFQLEASGMGADEVIASFWRSFGADADPEGRDYAEEAVRGVCSDVERLDEQIAAASANWRVERMARVDRNVLRLGAWELAHRPDVPWLLGVRPDLVGCALLAGARLDRPSTLNECQGPAG